jgi:NAD(P)H-hydrate epimerase
MKSRQTFSGSPNVTKDANMPLSRDEARALDRRAMDEAGVPGVVLMENAGRGCAELLVRLGVQGRVVVCCGKGNNGGDGFVIARHLDNAGVAVAVHLFADHAELTGDAAVNYRILAHSGPPITTYPHGDVDDARLRQEFALADWIVDALFGSGLTGALRSPFDRIVRTINESSARVFAVDIPSGLDCDTGLPLGATVRAHHTATIAALKRGFVRPEAQAWVGKVHVIDMGVPRRMLETVVTEVANAKR